MSKHTPGPWIVDPNPELPLGVIEDNENGMGICEFPRRRTPEAEANARLIAAAPEMAGALRSILESYSSDEINEQPILVAARAALAKAGL